DRLSGGDLVQPQRLPERVHHVLFADRVRVLSAAAVRPEPGARAEPPGGGVDLGRGRPDGTGRAGAVQAAAAELACTSANPRGARPLPRPAPPPGAAPPPLRTP